MARRGGHRPLARLPPGPPTVNPAWGNGRRWIATAATPTVSMPAAPIRFNSSRAGGNAERARHRRDIRDAIARQLRDTDRCGMTATEARSPVWLRASSLSSPEGVGRCPRRAPGSRERPWQTSSWPRTQTGTYRPTFSSRKTTLVVIRLIIGCFDTSSAVSRSYWEISGTMTMSSRSASPLM